MEHVLDPNVVVCLEHLGYGLFFERQRVALAAAGEALEPARVAAASRGSLHLLTAYGPRHAVLAGRLLHEAEESAALPAVGDWVGLRAGAVAHRFERRTCLLRKAAGKRTEAQVLAANVDTVLIVTSLNADFNARRLERYVELTLDGGARPVFVLNKVDLCADPSAFVEVACALAPSAPVLPVSAIAGAGIDALAAHVHAGETVALVGSSGVGKSTLANRLLGAEVQARGDIRETDDRGRHTTTHRELFVLPTGGLLVDTPGLRELVPWRADDAAGPAGFDDVEAFAAGCRFRDCAHDGEPGCAVEAALVEGRLAEGRLTGFRKLARETLHLRELNDARARAETKRRMKAIAKRMRHHPKA